MGHALLGTGKCAKPFKMKVGVMCKPSKKLMCLLLQHCLVVNTCVLLEQRSWKQSENYKQYGTKGMMLYFAVEASAFLVLCKSELNGA